MKASILSAAMLGLCAWLALIGAGSALAQDPTPPPQAQGGSSSPGTERQADDRQSPTPPARDRFRPSEEVSPDQEVDFPADI
jgi:hypothetical protein